LISLIDNKIRYAWNLQVHNIFEPWEQRCLQCLLNIRSLIKSRDPKLLCGVRKKKSIFTFSACTLGIHNLSCPTKGSSLHLCQWPAAALVLNHLVPLCIAWANTHGMPVGSAIQNP
jgi:hypothetical protein